MSATTAEGRWEEYRERPFWRLVELFVERIFRGGGDSDTEGLDIGVGLVLTLLAMPGGFVSVLLFDKYGSLLQWLRGQFHVDTLLIALPDEYFFIVLSMTVTGMVAVWRWDAIFPDRRDYMNLAHLPVSSRTIFLANLMAVLLLAGLAAIDVNGASCVLFPMVVSAALGTLPFFVKFGLVHAAGVLLASVFAFFAVFTILGLLMAVLPPRGFRRVSAYFRGLVVVYLVTLLCTSFAVPSSLQRSGAPPAWTFFMPSCWFVSFCQLLRGKANPAMVELARLVVPGVVGVIAVAFCTYAIAYRRHFVRIGELSEGGGIERTPRRWRLTLLQRMILRTPFQSACFGFAWKTMVRSEAHRLVLTGIGGLALVLASQAMMNAVQGTTSWRQAALTPDALSIPFVITFLLIIGMRIAFEIPVEQRANWVFQFLLDADRQECDLLARRVILTAILPWVLAITFVAYFYFEGWVVASLHTLLVLSWAVLLTNILLTRFRKLPFTCGLPVFKQHSIVILISFCFGYLIYAVSTPEFEASALHAPLRMLSLVPVAAVAWYIPRYLGKNTIELERKLIFEETAVRTVEGLRLSE